VRDYSPKSIVDVAGEELDPGSTMVSRGQADLTHLDVVAPPVTRA
jgi:hypothetical protein